MPVVFNKLYGNADLKSYFSSAIEQKKLPHALIFEGAKGSGKYSFALDVAAAMCCTSVNKPCYECDSCRKIYSGVYPDVVNVSLDEGKTSISVDAVRQIRSSATSVPVESDFKFYIIRDTERMTVQAQNALLKILEEPPTFVVFILLCTNASLLLPTIISRAAIFRMQRFTDAELNEYCLSHGYKFSDPDELSYIVMSANGAIGNLKAMDKRTITQLSKQYEETISFFETLTSTDKIKYMGLEEKFLSKKREELSIDILRIRNALRDILCAKNNIESDSTFFIDINDALLFSSFFTMESIVNMISLCDEALSKNDANANINLLKINFMSKLWKIAHE